MIDNKKADTRAVNILIAMLIIGLVILIFYMYLVSITITRTNNAISGNLGTLELDHAFANWVSTQPEDLYNLPVGVSKKFETYFKQQGYKVYSVLGGVDFVNYQEEPPACKEINALELSCEFMLEKGTNADQDLQYERTILLPSFNGIRKLNFKGVLRYE